MEPSDLNTAGTAAGSPFKTADSIINDHFLTRKNDLSFLLNAPIEELCKGADRIRAHYKGSRASLCSIINGRSGRCSEDCKFCAQSAHHHTHAKTYPFLPENDILKDAQYHDAMNIDRYSIVTSGRALSGEEFEQALNTYKKISGRYKIKLCASHGLLDMEAFRRLKESGVSRYHANIETSRRNFPNICTTHTYDDKCRVIRMAKESGLEVCSGGIIGMGETWEDRIDMALDLCEMGVVSIPLNILQPIPGTPFENLPGLSEDNILRTVAIFRYLNPKTDIRLAAGRIYMKDSGRNAFLSGANAAITGDMLTTSGNNIRQDIEMLKELGYELREKELP